MKTPTPEQQTCINKLVKFYYTPGATFALLEGWAGVGKTFTIQRVIETLQAENPRIQIALTAPTHKAVKVLQYMALELGLQDIELVTIYSSLGLIVNSNDEVKHVAKSARGNFSDMDLVIVDEVSMLNRQVVAELRASAQSLGIPVILMGDSFQLPPVKEKNSPAFENVQLRLRLDKIMRQEEGNPILELTASLREDIKNNTSNTVFRSKVDKKLDKGVYCLNGKAWVESVKNNFASDEYKEDPDLFRCVAWHNYRIDALNASIRKLLVGETESPYIAGERLITKQSISLGEGADRQPLASTDEECIVLDIVEDLHPKYLNTTVQFKVWTIRLMTPREEIAEVYLLHGDSEKQYWSTLNQMIEFAHQDRSQWKAKHDFQESFASLQPPHAITVHRSQGSTFKNVFVDLIDCWKNPDSMERNKLLYVAASRASENLICLKRPQ